MNLKTCAALIGTLMATFIFIDSGSSDSNVHAAGVSAMISHPSAATHQRDAKQIAAMELAFSGDCYNTPRPVAAKLAPSTNGPSIGHRPVGSSNALQIACARG